MNKIAKVLLVINILFLISISHVYANCSDSEYNELRSLAKKIEFSYEEEELDENSDGLNMFDVYAYNFSNKFYLYSKNSDEVYTNDDNSKTEFIGNFSSGITLRYDVYIASGNCAFEKVYSLKYNLPTYNKYYKNTECKGNEELDICKKWYDSSNITETEFKKIIDGNTKISFKDKLLNLIVNYYWILIIALFIIVIPILIIRIVKNRKRVKIEI